MCHSSKMSCLFPLFLLLSTCTLASAVLARGPCNRPTIVAITPTTNSSRSSNNYAYLGTTYGEVITLTCASTASSTLMFTGDTNGLLEDKLLNSSAIQGVIKGLDVGQYWYYCIDRNPDCNYGMFINVLPAISVASPNVRHTLENDGSRTYFLTREEDYDVFCSAKDINSLSLKVQRTLFDDRKIITDWLPIPTRKINETTVAATEKALEDRTYQCTVDKMRYGPSVRVIVQSRKLK